MSPTRREFLRGLAGVAGAAAVTRGGMGAFGRGAPSRVLPGRLPPPEASGVDHVVVVMMENRSFDHYLGWVPGANGRQAGLVYTDSAGVPHTTSHWPEFQGCAHPDPDHSFEGGRVQYNGGRCDGWLRSGENDDYSIGYYTDADLAFYRRAARDWTVCDNYFAAIMAETYPNRFYQHAAQTDRLHNSSATASMPTIWDRLAAAGLSSRYYFSDAPFTALWGTKYLEISRPFPTFLADCATGNLPEVAFVDSRFLDEGSGNLGRRSSARRHSRRPAVPQPDLRGGHPEPRLGEHGPRHQLRRVGRRLRPRPTCSRAGRQPRVGPAGVSRPVPRHLAAFSPWVGPPR